MALFSFLVFLLFGKLSRKLNALLCFKTISFHHFGKLSWDFACHFYGELFPINNNLNWRLYCASAFFFSFDWRFSANSASYASKYCLAHIFRNVSKCYFNSGIELCLALFFFFLLCLHFSKNRVELFNYILECFKAKFASKYTDRTDVGDGFDNFGHNAPLKCELVFVATQQCYDFYDLASIRFLRFHCIFLVSMC